MQHEFRRHQFLHANLVLAEHRIHPLRGQLLQLRRRRIACLTGMHTARNERQQQMHRFRTAVEAQLGRSARSEEHTSELQSLLRISYAVLCLKTKKTYNLMINDRKKT